MPFRLILTKDGRFEEDVTLSGRYMPIVMLTQTVREALCQHASLRQPFLNLLHHTYKNLNAKAKLEEARCSRPDDADIRYFFRHHFPNVRLVGGAGRTNVSDHAACDDNVQIAYRLARCLTLSAKAKSYNKQIDPSQIIASYIAVLLHELAHSLLIWWSRGDCRTPDFGPLLRESGQFVEEAFLGGVLEGWWAKHQAGHFKCLRKLVIETRSGFFLELDEYSATAFYQRFNTSPTSLPLIHAISMRTALLPNPARTSRTKINRLIVDTSHIGREIVRCSIGGNDTILLV